MAPTGVSADNKKKKQFVPADNPVEIFKDLGATVAREATSVPTQILDTAFEQIGLKPQKQPLSGEFNIQTGAHQVLEQAKVVDQKDNNLDAKMRQLQYVQRQEKEVFSMKQHVLEDQINKLLSELQLEVTKLQKQTTELATDVKRVTVETKPAKAGIYHLNFFDQVIVMLREIRHKVGESRQWLAMSANKKQQKGYWAMFKKHGNNFAMSDERGIATANG